jgi:hypothetical protein
MRGSATAWSGSRSTPSPRRSKKICAPTSTTSRPTRSSARCPTRVYTDNGSDANLYGLEPNFGCCTANMHQGWPEFASHLWARSPDGGLAAMVVRRLGGSSQVTVELRARDRPRAPREVDHVQGEARWEPPVFAGGGADPGQGQGAPPPQLDAREERRRAAAEEPGPQRRATRGADADPLRLHRPSGHRVPDARAVARLTGLERLTLGSHT